MITNNVYAPPRGKAKTHKQFTKLKRDIWLGFFALMAGAAWFAVTNELTVILLILLVCNTAVLIQNCFRAARILKASDAIWRRYYEADTQTG